MEAAIRCMLLMGDLRTVSAPHGSQKISLLLSGRRVNSHYGHKMAVQKRNPNVFVYLKEIIIPKNLHIVFIPKSTLGQRIFDRISRHSNIYIYIYLLSWGN